MVCCPVLTRGKRMIMLVAYIILNAKLNSFRHIIFNPRERVSVITVSVCLSVCH